MSDVREILDGIILSQMLQKQKLVNLKNKTDPKIHNETQKKKRRAIHQEDIKILNAPENTASTYVKQN